MGDEQRLSFALQPVERGHMADVMRQLGINALLSPSPSFGRF